MTAHSRMLGRVEYEDGLRLQEQLVGERQEGRIPDQVLTLEHPHVFTLGRRANAGNILIDAQAQRRFGVQVFESVRGGDVTYHGPGQIVVYPILALPPGRQDVVRYVRDLEQVMIRTLAGFGIEAGQIEGLSGTWVGPRKIGAIGVRMSRWVTSHGIALNVNTDLRYFDLIVPCGIRDHGVTSMQRELGRPIELETVRTALLHELAQMFDLQLEPRAVDLKTIQAIVFRTKPQLQILNLLRTPALGGFWQPVTGRIEAGETPIEAAAREVQEETGYSGEPIGLGYVHGFMLDPTVFQAPRWPVPCFADEHSFAVEVPTGQEPVLEEGTHEAYQWLSPDASTALVRWPGNREAIRMLTERLSQKG